MSVEKSGFRSVFLLPAAVATLLTVGCSAISELPPAKASDGAEHRRFRVECVEMAQCQKRARVACGSKYEVLSEWHNEIPESQLPGLNEASYPKDGRDYARYRAALPDRTGIESDDPMPLASIVVACNG